MVESTQPNYDVSFEMKKHFTPSEITGKLLFPSLQYTRQLIYLLIVNEVINFLWRGCNRLTIERRRLMICL